MKVKKVKKIKAEKAEQTEKKAKKSKGEQFNSVELAEKCELSQKDVKGVFKALVDTLEQMPVGSKFKVQNLGVFVKKKREARTARNPFNGGKVEVPAKVGIKFKISNTLKDL